MSNKKMEDLVMKLARLSNDLFPSFPSFTRPYFEGDLMDWNSWNFAGVDASLPAVNVQETSDEFHIDVAAPGLKKSDFKMNYENGRLTIASEKENKTEKKEKGKVTRREFNYQSFQRTFDMSEELVDAEKISARYTDGILHVSIPKREEVKPKPARSIKIS